MASEAGELLMTRRLCSALHTQISYVSNVDKGTSPVLKARMSVNGDRRVSDDEIFFSPGGFLPPHSPWWGSVTNG